MLKAQNNWQNIGIMWKFSSAKIPGKYRNVFMTLVQESFGYGKPYIKTNMITLSKKTGFSKPTLILHIKWLKENNFIKIFHAKRYIEGGGKESYTYYPCFPDIGHIKLISAKIKEEKNPVTEELLKVWEK